MSTLSPWSTAGSSAFSLTNVSPDPVPPYALPQPMPGNEEGPSLLFHPFPVATDPFRMLFSVLSGRLFSSDVESILRLASALTQVRTPSAGRDEPQRFSSKQR